MEFHEIACEYTKTYVSSKTIPFGIDRLTKTKYQYKVFHVSFDPWQKVKINKICPYCNQPVTLEITSPRKIISEQEVLKIEQESLKKLVKQRKMHIIIGATVCVVFFTAGAIALFFKTLPIFYAAPFFIGICGLIASIGSYTEKIKTLKISQLIDENIVVSEGHFLMKNIIIDVGSHKI